MIKLDLPDIQEHFKTKRINTEIQKETNQLLIVQQVSGKDFPIFIRIFNGGELLQMLAFLPYIVKQAALGDTARLLHLLNKEVDVPGFGMDESTAVVFYRCMIPAKNNQIDNGIFDAYFNALLVLCQSFANIIASVSSGHTPFEDVLKATKDQNNSIFSQPELNKE